MAKIVDRVKETTTTTGTGAYALVGPLPRFIAFGSVSPSLHGASVYYAVEDSVSDFEVGRGTYDSGTNTLTRDEIILSSNSNMAVNWAAGTKIIWCNAPSRIMHEDLADDDHPQYVLHTEVDDVPVNGATTDPISSNWAFDHENAVDPHPQYLTAAEGAAAFDPLGAAAAAVSAHEAALDPHPQYLTPAEGDALFLTQAEGDGFYAPITEPIAAAHIADATDAHDASAISVVPFGSIGATDVQAALQEIVAEAVTDHGALTGLADDDHVQYFLADGTRTITGDTTIQASVSGALTLLTENTGGGTAHAEHVLKVPSGVNSNEARTVYRGQADWSVGVNNDDTGAFMLTTGTSLGGFGIIRVDPSTKELLMVRSGIVFADRTGGSSFTKFRVQDQPGGDITYTLPAADAAGFLQSDGAGLLSWVAVSSIDHGALTGLGDDDHPQYVLHTEVDDVPVNGATTDPISSNWAFDHENAADPHPGYLTQAEGDALYSPLGHTHDHGALTGLGDDDHPQYTLADGTRAFTGSIEFSADNTHDIGAAGADRPRTGYFGTSVVTPTVSTGGATSLSLATSGGQQVQIAHVASAVNYITLAGGATGNDVDIIANGSDANITLSIEAKGTGTINLQSGVVLANTLKFNAAASQIIPGATSISLRNNANSADNILVLDSGDTAIRGKVGVDGQAVSSSTSLATPAATTAKSSVRVPHGSAPTTPTDGDVWTTTAGMFARINGVTVGPFGTASPSPFAVFMGGATFAGGDAGLHFREIATNTATPQTIGNNSQMYVPKAGTVKYMSWSTATGDGTTVFKIVKNGTVAQTITLSGATGSVATGTVAVVAGDALAVEYDAGTAPGNSSVILHAE
jgi:hypothetical protein